MTHTDQIKTIAGTLLKLPYETWNFGDSVAFEALIEATDALDDPKWAAFTYGWARAWATRAKPFRELDCTAPGWAIVHLAQRFDDGLLMQAAVELGDHLMARPTICGLYRTWVHSPLRHPYGPATLPPAEAALMADPPAGSFLDCLHFDPPFLTALGRATGRTDFTQAGIEQALAYIRVLQRPNGIFDHFVLDGHPGTYGPGWGRGQGWALLGLLDVLEELADSATPKATLDELKKGVTDLINGMIPLQGDDGHWPSVVNVATSDPEASTAAFMAAGFYRALKMGVVDDPRVAASAKRATDAVLASLDKDGGLLDVSAAVMACTQPTHYEHVPRGFRVPWGQGPALLALSWADRWKG